MMKTALDEIVVLAIHDQLVALASRHKHGVAVVLDGGEIVSIFDVQAGKRSPDAVIEIDGRLADTGAAASIFRRKFALMLWMIAFMVQCGSAAAAGG
ncbi:hypothetical protein PPNSA23_37760 [Phyllobacterium phragmitis]|uniref:Uncharacterized protein n=1 Tax=Phyllobacterium phragmitis TaxID=2670329 RepID=A0ABQ0H4I0_9HYPH